MTQRVVRHPETEKLFREAARKIVELRRTHMVATDLMWAGTLVMRFSDDELALLKEDFLSERDHQILRKVGRPVKRAARRKEKP